MKIWKLDFVTEAYDNVSPEEVWSFEKIRSFDGRSQIDNWKPFKVIKSDPERELELSNAPRLYTTLPTFDEKAKNALEKYCLGFVEFLPLICENKKLWAFNVIRVLDCIDYEKSEYKTFSDGKRIMHFKKYVFRENIVKNQSIFKIIDKPLALYFVSDEFKRIVEENKLTGFKFELVWDSEED